MILKVRLSVFTENIHLPIMKHGQMILKIRIHVFFWEYSLSYDETEIYDFEGKNVFTDNTHFPIMKQR